MIRVGAAVHKRISKIEPTRGGVSSGGFFGVEDRKHKATRRTTRSLRRSHSHNQCLTTTVYDTWHGVDCQDDDCYYRALAAQMVEEMAHEVPQIRPHAYTMGVETTIRRKTAEVSLDWLTITFESAVANRYRSVPDAPLDIYRFTKAIDLPVAEWGERKARSFGYVRVYELDGLPGALLREGGTSQKGTVSLQLSARALEFYNSRLQGELLSLVKMWVEKLNAEATRLDHAFDDRGGRVVYERVKQAFIEKSVVRRARAKAITGERPLGGEGWTISSGSRNSGKYVRIYDKAAERRQRVGESVAGPWVRAEVEYKGVIARQVLKEWIKADFSSKCAVGFLRGAIDFRVKRDDKAKSRWPMADWWAAFIGEAQARVVGLRQQASTLDSKAKWLKEQVSKSLAEVAEVQADFVQQMLGYGRERMQSSDWRQVRAAKEAGMLNPFTLKRPEAEVSAWRWRVKIPPLVALRQALDNRNYLNHLWQSIGATVEKPACAAGAA